MDNGWFPDFETSFASVVAEFLKNLGIAGVGFVLVIIAIVVGCWRRKT